MYIVKLIIPLIALSLLAQTPPARTNPQTGKSDYYGALPWQSDPTGVACSPGSLALYNGTLYVCTAGVFAAAGGGAAAGLATVPTRTNATTVDVPSHYLIVPNKAQILVDGDLVLTGAGSGTVYVCGADYGEVAYYSGTATLGTPMPTGMTNGGANPGCLEGQSQLWEWTVTTGNWVVGGYTSRRTLDMAPVKVKAGSGMYVDTDPADGAWVVTRDQDVDTEIHELFNFFGSIYPLVKVDGGAAGSLAPLSTSQLPDATTHPGMLRLATPASAATSCAIVGNSTSQSSFLNMATSTAGWDFRAAVRTPTTSVSGATLSFGLVVNSVSLFGVTKRITIERAHTDANWFYYVCDGVTCGTPTDSGVALANNGFVRMRIRSIINGQIKFSINNGTETTISANLPGTFDANLGFCVANTGATTSALPFDIDRLEVHMSTPW
jgi:hypothetical protein